MEVGDKAYCFEIARRSVSRAALHLGIESMSEESLDAMADILLEYLGRFGKTLSHLVETSGRTSSHCNVLDAFATAELVTSPSVSRLHFDASGGHDSMLLGDAGASATQKAAMKQRSMNNVGWRQLAEFCFGHKWLDLKVSGVHDRSHPLNVGTARGGKQGPSAAQSAAAASANGDANGTAKGAKADGWIAPYLHEVVPFPRASPDCANPHCLDPKIALSLHPKETYTVEDTVEQEIVTTEADMANLPDELFSIVTEHHTGWGNPMSQRKRKMDSMGRDGGAGGIAGADDTSNDVAMKDADGKKSASSKKDKAMSPPPSKKAKTAASAGDGSSKQQGKSRSQAKGKGKSKAAAAAAASSKAGGNASNNNEGNKADADGNDNDEGREAAVARPAYLPSFYPLPPPIATDTAQKNKRSIVDDSKIAGLVLPTPNASSTAAGASSSSTAATAAATTATTKSGSASQQWNDGDVKSSLVELGTYWGSGWDDAIAAAKLAVPLGRKNGQGGSSSDSNAAIVPLGRASGSRISRILEGSMDAAAMQ